jgi:hypothetical protein
MGGAQSVLVQQIDPHDGEVLWFTDQLALSLLKKEPKEQNRMINPLESQDLFRIENFNPVYRALPTRVL